MFNAKYLSQEATLRIDHSVFAIVTGLDKRHMHEWRTTRRTRRTHSYVRDCTCAVAQLACVCMVPDSTETYMKKHTSVRQRTLRCSRLG